MGCYIKAVREEIPHFPIVFLSLLFLTNKSSLLSPIPPFLLRWVSGEEVVVQRRRRRWSAVVDGGAAAKKPFFYSFHAYSLLLLFLKLFLTPKSLNTNPKFLDLQKNETKERKCYPYALFGRWHAIGLDGFTTVGFGLCGSRLGTVLVTEPKLGVAWL